MKSMFSKHSGKSAELSAAWNNMTPRAKSVCRASVATAVLMTPSLAFAADGSGNAFFCFISNYLKGIVGGCALVVIMLWAIEHFFGQSKLHDVIIKVGVGAAIVAGSSIIIANSGLIPPSCGLGI